MTALENAGYAVDKAFDGEEGLYLGETEPYDAVILDLEIDQTQDWTLQLGKSGGAQVILAFERGTLTVDRSTTRYPHGDSRRVRIPDLDRLVVTVVHDRSVTEVFVSDGHTAFSLRSYLDPDGFQVAITGRVGVNAATATILESPQ